MEINEINNTKLTKSIADTTVQVLLSNNLITNEELNTYNVQFGYIFTKTDGVLEALIKTSCNGKTFYFACQKGSLMLININEEQYIQTINYMKENHPCLNEVPNTETEVQKNRREKNNQYLSQIGITYNDKLLCDEYDINMKSLDDICKRAIASLITIQVACDINTGIDIKSEEYKESFDFIKSLYKKYGVEDCLNSKEQRIIDGTYSRQDALDMDWEYETYWAICWCLSLVDDIKDGGELCDCEKAISFVMSASSYEDFKSKCKLRSLDEILDMYDLYYRYNWAINNVQVNPNTNIGNLDPSNVIERRRALEWVITDMKDWYDLRLDT